MKKAFLTVLMVVAACFFLFAETDNLLLSGVPVLYGEEEFIARINERCNGREPIGLVLTGGSARALAHIGVLKYLEENGIVPDFIISNSMGSIIAMTYAAGMSPDQILSMCTSFDLGSLFDISLPLGRGLLATEGLESLVASVLGENLRLEDLEIPVMIIAEDLVTKRQIRICSGDFYTVFTASYALPVFFSSVDYEGHLLTDGGIANIAPLDVAYEYGNKNIIASTFYSGKDLNLKNPVTALNTAIDIGKRRQGMEDILSHPEAIWIRCDVEDFSFMEFSAGSLMTERGYLSAAEHAGELSELCAGAKGVTGEMTEKREEYALKLEELVETWRPQSHIRLHRLASYPSLNLGEPNSVRAGWKLGTGDLEVFGGAGFSFEINSRGSYIRPEAVVQLDYHPASRALVHLDFTYIPWKSFDLSEKFEYVVISSDTTRLSLGENAKWFSLDSLLLAEVFGDLSMSIGRSGKLNALAAFEWIDRNPGVKLSGSWSMNFPGSVFGFSAKADASYIFNVNSIRVNADARLFWRNTDFRPTFAEMVLMSDVRAGVFGTYSYTNGLEGLDLVAGVFVSADTNLIGLVSIPADIKAGWDFLYNRVYFSLTFGR